MYYYKKAPYTVYVRQPRHDHFRGIPAYTASEAVSIAREYIQEGCVVSIYDRTETNY